MWIFFPFHYGATVPAVLVDVTHYRFFYSKCPLVYSNLLLTMKKMSSEPRCHPKKMTKKIVK